MSHGEWFFTLFYPVSKPRQQSTTRQSNRGGGGGSKPKVRTGKGRQTAKKGGGAAGGQPLTTVGCGVESRDGILGLARGAAAAVNEPPESLVSPQLSTSGGLYPVMRNASCQNAATRRSTQREERVTVQGPRKETATRQNVTQGEGKGRPTSNTRTAHEGRGGGQAQAGEKQGGHEHSEHLFYCNL